MVRAGVLVLLFAAAALAAAHATVVRPNAALDDEYVVVFKSTSTLAARAAHMHALKASGARIIHRYAMGDFNGYSARLNNAARALLDSEIVQVAERNQVYKAAMATPEQQAIPRPASEPQAIPRPAPQQQTQPRPAAHFVENDSICKVQRGATWSLARANKEELEIDGFYSVDAATIGQNVRVYIIDSGIYLEHLEFEGRAIWGYDAIEDPSPETDPFGHGTHVAGTVGGATFGMSKNATLVAVRVLNQAGIGSTSGIIAGLNYVTSVGVGNYSVALLAIEGPMSVAINTAVASVTAHGIPVIVPVGNTAEEACVTTPASESSAFRVGASDSLDNWWPMSNWGNCTDIIAPGVGISSAYIGNPFSQNTLTGTSMAAANVAGAVANFLSGLPPASYSPTAVRAFFTGTANNGVLHGISPASNTPNSLLYVPCY